MLLLRFEEDGVAKLGLAQGDALFDLSETEEPKFQSLSALLVDEAPADELIRQLRDAAAKVRPRSLGGLLVRGEERDAGASLRLLPPIDQQEVWAAGVTYKRSEEARKAESEGAALFYGLVYDADRPELFFKATPHRTVGSFESVGIRKDARWNVPEPELGVVLTAGMEILGYTIGNDMSSRDIEGENPLYLPQAKVYDKCCALGPAIALADAVGDPHRLAISMRIERDGVLAFAGETSTQAMKRSIDELVQYLARSNRFPRGAALLTGTGIVPDDSFSLVAGDVVTIEIEGLGRLVNTVEVVA